MKSRTLKSMNISGLTTLLNAIPGECEMREKHRKSSSYDDAKTVVIDALSKLTADQVEALEVVLRDCLHARVIDFEDDQVGRGKS